MLIGVREVIPRKCKEFFPTVPLKRFHCWMFKEVLCQPIASNQVVTLPSRAPTQLFSVCYLYVGTSEHASGSCWVGWGCGVHFSGRALTTQNNVKVTHLWFYSSLSPPAENICGTNWHLVSNSCLKITNAKENYDHAKLSCRSSGASLASLTTQKKVEFVLKELQKMQSSVSASLLCPLSN